MRHELQIHEITGLVDVQAELKEQVMQKFAMEAALLALDQQAKDGDTTDRVAAALLGIVMDQAVAQQPDYGLEDTPFSLGTLLAADDTSYPFRSAADLLDNVKTFMQPAYDEQQQNLKVENVGDRRVLLANLRPAQQQWLAHFLELQRGNDGWTADITAHVFTVAQDSGLFTDGDAMVLGTPMEFQLQREAVVAVAHEEISSPRLLTLPGQEGSISILDQHSYISDWELAIVEPRGISVPDPTIEVIASGLVLELRVHQATDELYGLHVASELTRLEEPIPTRMITLDGTDFEISMPEVVTADIATAMLLPDGAGVMLRSPNYRDGEDLVLLVSFSRVAHE
jgi:hypothetical protein